MLGAMYGFGLSVDLLLKPVIHGLRSKSEVHTDNPQIVLSTAQTFAPRSARQIRGSRRPSLYPEATSCYTMFTTLGSKNIIWTIELCP